MSPWVTPAEVTPDLWADAGNLEPETLALYLTASEEACAAYAPTLAAEAAVPLRYKLGVILHARDMWNASRRSPEGTLGPDGIANFVRPLSLDVKQTLRPRNPRSTFGAGTGAAVSSTGVTVDQVAAAVALEEATRTQADADLLAAITATADGLAAVNASLTAEKWVYDHLAATATTTAAGVDATVAGFEVPAGLPNGLYELEGRLLVQSSTADGSTALRWGLGWGASAPIRAILQTSQPASVSSLPTYAVPNTLIVPASTVGAPNAGLATITALFRAVAMVDPITVVFRSETEGTPVSILADSFLRWRKVAA